MDYAHKETEGMLDSLEKRLAHEYAQAERELTDKLDDYMWRHSVKDRIWLNKVANGEITWERYQQWKIGQVCIGERWTEMRDTIAEDMHHTNEIAGSIVNGYLPEVYALNHNYATYEAEVGALVDTSYTLYDRQTVERLMRDNPDMLPPPGERVSKKIRDGKDIRWNEQQLQSIATQSILQGEDLTQTANRLRSAFGDSFTIDDIRDIEHKTASQIAKELTKKNKSAAIRNARTMMTGAQNAGRVDGYKRAKDMGIDLRQQWLATLDGRTRHEHRQLDGQIVDVGKPFKVDGYEIRFPGDPTAEAHLVYNCRCTLIAAIKGFEHDLSDTSSRYDANLEGMTYEEWKKAKEKKSAAATAANNAELQAKRNAIKDSFGAQFRDMPQEYKDAIYSVIDNTSEEMVDVIGRTSDGATVLYYDEPGTCCKLGGQDTIRMYSQSTSGTRKTPEEFARTYFHEYGHLTDMSQNGGYGWTEVTVDRRGNEHTWRWDGIREAVRQDNAYQNAAVADINNFMERYGIGGKYKAEVSEWNSVIIRKADGSILDTLDMSFDDSKTLSDAMSQWVHDASGKTNAWNYLRNQGYPQDPEWGDYFEMYRTPKRGIVRSREKYKGARDDWTAALTKANEEKEAFRSTHDMDKLYQKQQSMIDEAEKKEDALGFVTDTFDEAASGAFTAVVHGGHSARYYMEGHGEGIANVFSTVATNDAYMLDGMQDLCPNIYGLIEGVIRNG